MNWIGGAMWYVVIGYLTVVLLTIQEHIIVFLVTIISLICIIYGSYVLGFHIGYDKNTRRGGNIE